MDSQKAFVTSRENPLSRPVLRLSDHTKPFVLRTDALNCGLGGALMQVHDRMYYSTGRSQGEGTGAMTPPPLNFQHCDFKKIKFDRDLQRMLRNYCLLYNYTKLVLYGPLPSFYLSIN